jgi:hypothetical protein
MDWINLAQDTKIWRAVVNTTMIPYGFLTRRGAVSFSRRNLLHVISYFLCLFSFTPPRDVSPSGILVLILFLLRYILLPSYSFTVRRYS